jgi:hypothetical protein
MPPDTCDVCNTTLNPVLIKMDLARHPCCDPDEQPGDWRRRPSELAAESRDGNTDHAPADEEDKPVMPVTNIEAHGLF